MQTRPKFRYYIFDLDGTLTDSSLPIGEGLVKALEAAGIHGIPAVDTYRWIGRPLTEIFDAYLLEHNGGRVGEQLFQTMLEAYRDGHDAHFPQGVKIYPDVLATLGRLRQGGAKLAIATTKYQEAAEFVARGLELDAHVDVVCGTDLGKPVKPDPFVIHLALERLGATPGDTLVVGDTPGDVGAAHAAGCQAAVVSYGFGDHTALRALNPEYWLDRLNDLP